MLFEEIENIKFRKYTSDISEVERHITLSKETAEEVNKVIAVANKGSRAIKLNSTILFNIALKKYFEELAELPSEEIIALLRKEALAEIGL